MHTEIAEQSSHRAVMALWDNSTGTGRQAQAAEIMGLSL